MQKLGKDIRKLMNKMGKARQAFVFIIDYKRENGVVLSPGQLATENVFVSMPGLHTEMNAPDLGNFDFQKKPVSFELYKKAFEKVIKSIERGDSFLLNLTFPTTIQSNLSLDQIYKYSQAPYRLNYRNQFVVFSPESFVKIHNDKISGYPMKGTMDAGIENAGQKLMDDIKELSEHNTIVDLIRNDLSMVSKNVRVEKFRYMEKVATHNGELLQTSSKITGTLPDDWKSKIGDIIFRMLPAGSITGAPKLKTTEIIEEVEGYSRGWFTGVFGYFDGGNLDSAVMIRFIEKQGDKLIYKSGGGITWFSKVEDEYQELLKKVYVPVHRNNKG